MKHLKLFEAFTNHLPATDMIINEAVNYKSIEKDIIAIFNKNGFTEMYKSELKDGIVKFNIHINTGTRTIEENTPEMLQTLSDIKSYAKGIDGPIIADSMIHVGKGGWMRVVIVKDRIKAKKAWICVNADEVEGILKNGIKIAKMDGSKSNGLYSYQINMSDTPHPRDRHDNTYDISAPLHRAIFAKTDLEVASQQPWIYHNYNSPIVLEIDASSYNWYNDVHEERYNGNNKWNSGSSILTYDNISAKDITRSETIAAGETGYGEDTKPVPKKSSSPTRWKKEYKAIEKEYNNVTYDSESITVWDFEDNKDYAVVFTWYPEEETANGEDQRIARSDDGDKIKTAEDFIDFVNDHAPEA
jgi:hypothetical protein